MVKDAEPTANILLLSSWCSLDSESHKVVDGYDSFCIGPGISKIIEVLSTIDTYGDAIIVVTNKRRRGRMNLTAAKFWDCVEEHYRYGYYRDDSMIYKIPYRNRRSIKIASEEEIELIKEAAEVVITDAYEQPIEWYT